MRLMTVGELSLIKPNLSLGGHKKKLREGGDKKGVGGGTLGLGKCRS